MVSFIRQLVQKLKKDIKVGTQDSSSHGNGNTYVARSLSKEFDDKYYFLLKNNIVSENSYRETKNYYCQSRQIKRLANPYNLEVFVE